MNIFYIHYVCLKNGKTVQEMDDKVNLFASRKEAKNFAEASVEVFNVGCKAGIWNYIIKKM